MRPKNPRETPNPDEELAVDDGLKPIVLDVRYELTGKLLTLVVLPAEGVVSLNLNAFGLGVGESDQP